MDEISKVSCTPSEIAEIAKSVALNLLPEKSRDKYEIRYERFRKWCDSKETKNISENILLAFLPRKPR